MYVDRRYDLERDCNNRFGELRVRLKDGEWWFCVTDICNAINEASEAKQGKRPKTTTKKLQLELEETKKQVASLVEITTTFSEFLQTLQSEIAKERG